MATRSHLGLRPKNSPSLVVLQQKKSVDNSVLSFSPSKVKNVPISPAAISLDENKENIGIQTVSVDVTSTECQTDVSACSPCPKVTSADLQADEAPTHYYKALMLSYEKSLDSELDLSLSIQADEQESIDELNRTQEALNILKEVCEDIAQEEEETEQEPSSGSA